MCGLTAWVESRFSFATRPMMSLASLLREMMCCSTPNTTARHSGKRRGTEMHVKKTVRNGGIGMEGGKGWKGGWCLMVHVLYSWVEMGRDVIHASQIG